MSLFRVGGGNPCPLEGKFAGLLLRTISHIDWDPGTGWPIESKLSKFMIIIQSQKGRSGRRLQIRRGLQALRGLGRKGR